MFDQLFYIGFTPPQILTEGDTVTGLAGLAVNSWVPPAINFYIYIPTLSNVADLYMIGEAFV